ncbi:MAG: family 78 glycoside hydrolase catalytic domain, partial [Bacteroidaceae bacterium]|nr:family 78 glycoside hydrolase catalytic domain [Bacteroidaceae bacterium]
MKRILSVLAFALSLNAMAQEATDLRTEGMKEPLGIDNTAPHFNWKISSEQPFCQKAYELEVATSPTLLKEGKPDVWSSGQVGSAQQVMVPYAGTPLKARQLYYWHVRSWNGEKWTPWSTVQRFGIGIMKPDGMRGAYIGLGLGEKQSILVRKTFQVDKKTGTALLYVNSLGYHEAYLNGKPVSQAVLTPAVSQMDRRSQIVTYDVTPLIKKGKNTLVIWAGSGWYKKNTFHAAFEGPLVRADLDLQTAEGNIALTETDTTWQGRAGGYEDTGSWRAGQFGGERIDAALVPTNMAALAKEKDWQAVCTADIEGIEATPQMCQLNCIKETITPASIEDKGDGRWMIDMGRVVNGLFEIELRGLSKGQEVKASYCDHMQELEKFGGPNWGEDIYVGSGKGGKELFRNRFNHHLFRYVLLSGLSYQPEAKDIRAHRIGMDIERTGT